MQNLVHCRIVSVLCLSATTNHGSKVGWQRLNERAFACRRRRRGGLRRRRSVTSPGTEQAGWCQRMDPQRHDERRTYGFKTETATVRSRFKPAWWICQQVLHANGHLSARTCQKTNLAKSGRGSRNAISDEIRRLLNILVRKVSKLDRSENSVRGPGTPTFVILTYTQVQNYGVPFEHNVQCFWWCSQ